MNTEELANNVEKQLNPKYENDVFTYGQVYNAIIKATKGDNFEETALSAIDQLTDHVNELTDKLKQRDETIKQLREALKELWEYTPDLEEFSETDPLAIAIQRAGKLLKQ